jgi:acetyl-CoA acyltransferase
MKFFLKRNNTKLSNLDFDGESSMVSWYTQKFKDPKLEPVLVDYIRTPLGSKKGTINRLRGDDLFIHVLKSIKKRNPAIDWLKLSQQGLTDVLCGCNSQIGSCALDIAKTSALGAGYPMELPGVSLNRQCASGMQAVYFGWMEIASGDKEVVLAGGVEAQNIYPIMADMNVPDATGGVLTIAPNASLARNPYVMESTKKYSEVAGIPADLSGQINSAEIMGRVWQLKSGLSYEAFRDELDKLSVHSHKKAGEHFDDRAKEIEPIEVPKLNEQGRPMTTPGGELIPGQTEITSKDESIRPIKGMLEKMKTLPGIIKRKTGLLTAGNSCPTTDGAAVTLWTSRKFAEEHGLKIRSTLEACVSIGTDTVLMLTGPIEAIPLALKRAQLKLDDMSVIEVNEAFSTVVYATCHELGFKWDDPRLNPWGGAIAIGHPTGCTGARLIGTITTQLEQSHKKYGIGTLCVGLGMGIAGIVKREGA